MDTDSRKAQRDHYAHHRADLLFSRPPDRKPETAPPALDESTESDLARQRVRAGLIGFVPANATAGD